MPTLVALWPAEALAGVRLLILGGEACPPEIGARLRPAGTGGVEHLRPHRGHRRRLRRPPDRRGPVRIGLPLDGWDLAVVDADRQHVGPRRDRRADHRRHRAGALPRPRQGRREVRADAGARLGRGPTAAATWSATTTEGLVFVGRADDQVKLGGRRIELGEIDSALLALPGVTGAAAAVRSTKCRATSSRRLRRRDRRLRPAAALASCATALPAALVPRLAEVDALPTRTSGKIDRDALPWPLPTSGDRRTRAAALERHGAWIAAALAGRPRRRRHRPVRRLLRPRRGQPDRRPAGVPAACSGSPRSPSPTSTSSPTVGGARGRPRRMTAPPASGSTGRCGRCRSKTQAGQVVVHRPAAGALRPALGCLGRGGQQPRPRRWSGWTCLPTAALVVGRRRLAAAGRPARADGPHGGRRPAPAPRGRPGRLPARWASAPALWLAERLADELGAANLAGAPWMRVLRPGPGGQGRPARRPALDPAGDRDAHARRRVLDRARGRPDRALARRRRPPPRARRGRARAPASAPAAPLPGRRRSGRGAEVAPGSAVFGAVPGGEYWAGCARRRAGRRAVRGGERPPGQPPGWVRGVRRASARLHRVLPLLAVLAGAGVAVAAGCADAELARRRCAATAARRACRSSAVVGLVVAGPPGRGAGAAPRASVCAPGTTRSTAGRRGRPGPRSGCSTRRAPGCSRSTPAPSPPPGCACSVPGSGGGRGLDGAADPEADHRQRRRLPRRRHPARRLRARRRLAAHRAGQDRQARLRRQLRHGRSGPQGAEAGLVAVLSAAPRRTKAKAGMSWLGSPPTQLRRPVGGRRHQPHLPAAAPGSGSPARSSSCCRLVPVMVSLSPSSLGVVARPRGVARRRRLPGSPPCVGGPGAHGRRARSPPGSPRRPSGSWSAGSGSSEHPLWSSFVWRNELADTFVEVVGALRGSPAAATGTPVLNVWLRALGATSAGVWCETYWLPEADLVRAARRRRPSTRAAWCRPTCSTTAMLSMDRVTLRRRVDARAQQRHPPGGVLGGTLRSARVAGDERRVRARQDPLDRQPDRSVGRRGRPASTPREPTHATATTTSPGTATPSYDVTPLRPRPRPTGVDGNQLDRQGARSTASRVRTSTGWRSTCTGSTCGEGDRRRRAARRYTPRAGQLVAPPRTPGRRRARSSRSRCTTRGTRRRCRARPLGDGRLGGAHRRRHRRGAAPRGALLVPVQRPAAQQGGLPDRVTAPTAYHVVCNGTLAPAEQRGASATTWVYEQAEPMATVPRHRADRPLPVRRRARRPPCRARRASRPRLVEGVRRAPSAASPR